MKIIFAIALLLSIHTVFAQTVVNDPNVEPRNVPSFHAVQVSSAFEVMISQGNEASVAVSASSKDVISHIQTKVEDGVLSIWLDEKGKKWTKNRKLRAYISVKDMDLFKASGACDIKIDGQLKLSDLILVLSGASVMSGNLVISGKFKVDLSGASDLKITGSADEVVIAAEGASDVKAFDFVTSVCNVTASGASDVRITVDKEISAKLTGASSMSYKGGAIIKDIKTSGASSISKKS